MIAARTRARTISATISTVRTRAMIMAGGQGWSLGPLTCRRRKPALAMAGRYRMVDVVLSNLVNSGRRFCSDDQLTLPPVDEL